MGEHARIVRAAEARRMPWRNGGGKTVELAAHPPGAGLGAFDWRVSLARIERDGPFSTFPGVDRVFAVLDGDGVDLEIGAGPPLRLARGAAPARFPGEAPCRCRLVGGRVTALNVMVARGRADCSVAPLAAARGLPPTDTLRIVVCAEGTIETRAGTLGRHEALLVPAGAPVDILRSTGRGLVATLVIRPGGPGLSLGPVDTPG